MTQKEPLMTFDDAAAMGLSRDEWDLILKRLDRTPNQCELGIFSAMWSEHCSYKSSKKWLKTLPIDGPQGSRGQVKMPALSILATGLRRFLKLKAIIIRHLLNPIKARQLVLAVFCAMSLPWGRGRLLCSMPCALVRQVMKKRVIF